MPTGRGFFDFIESRTRRPGVSMNRTMQLLVRWLCPFVSIAALACGGSESEPVDVGDASPGVDAAGDSPVGNDSAQTGVVQDGDTGLDAPIGNDAAPADGASDGNAAEAAVDAGPDVVAPDGFTLVWSDEFDAPGLPDDSRWGYDVGGHGWGNGESQYYTDHRSENARVENGTLIIEAHKESFEGSEYTSARLVSTDKGDWVYGRFEARAILPAGRGSWPAIWMLPTDWTYGGWPDSGEIDIMEHVGYDLGNIHGTVHTKAYNHTLGTQKGGSTFVSDVTTNYHVYAVEWSPDRIDFFVDSTLYYTFEREPGDFSVWPFDQRFHFVLNVAIGGAWGGVQGIDDNAFPQRMVLDYVRVFQKP